MTGWREQLPARALEFAEGLESAGFEPSEPRNCWAGQVDGRDITVTIGDDFPFYPPKVRIDPPPQELTWHLERDGSMCLYTTAGRYGLPWKDAEVLLERVREWFHQADHGWPDDPGDPDLERYFGAADERLLITYEDIDDLVGHIFVERHVNDQWTHVTQGGTLTRQYARDKQRNRHRARWAFAADLGLLNQPVWDWKSICARAQLPDSLLALAESPGLAGTLLLRYQRDGVEGRRTSAVALQVAGGAQPEVRALRVAEDSPPARRRIRAGPDADMLGRKTVAIVGCGAVGSFLADLLARSGVGWLELVDSDYLRPSNCVRHLAPAPYVPRSKVAAVRDVLSDCEAMDANCIDVHPKKIDLELAIRLFRDADLIVDATADPSVEEILYHVAQEAVSEYVRVSVHRDGDLVRVDRLGRGTADSDHRPEPVEPREGADRATYREVGCGDPVSPAPPWAATAAANIACRWSIDTLRPHRQRQLPDSAVEVLRPQPDPPHMEVGTHT